MSTPIEILVVEDDADIANAIRDLLEEAGYRVSEARSGDDAYGRLMAGYRPTAMLVDCIMPGMTGAELLLRCEASPDLATIPALMMSAARPEEVAREGAGHYLPKPFRVADLLGWLAVVAPAPSPPGDS